MTVSSPAKPARSWSFSLALFTVATVGEFLALAGWYVLRHANPPLDAAFYRADDWLVRLVHAAPGAESLRQMVITLVQPFVLWWTPAGRLLQSSHAWLAVLVLLAGFVVERLMVVIWLRVPRLVITPGGRLRSRRMVLAAVTIAEIIVWVAWVRLAEGGNPIVATVVLVVGIHLVHAYEVGLVQHLAFPPLLATPNVIGITALESIGGVAAFWLATRGWIVWPLVVMAVALLTEHILQVVGLKKEAEMGG